MPVIHCPTEGSEVVVDGPTTWWSSCQTLRAVDGPFTGYQCGRDQDLSTMEVFPYVIEDATCVPLPEPNFVLGTLFGVLLIGALCEYSRTRREKRALRGLRVERQRRPLFRRVRKVLRRRLRLVGKWGRWRRF